MAQTAETLESQSTWANVSLKQIAYVFDVSPRRVQIYANEGMPKVSHGIYNLRDCHLWRVNELLQKKDDPANTSETDEKRELIRAQTAKYQVEAEKMRGTLIDAELVGQVLNEIGAIVSSQLDGLAPRVSGHLVGMRDQAEIQNYLFGECRQIRASLAEVIRKYAENPEGKK